MSYSPSDDDETPDVTIIRADKRMISAGFAILSETHRKLVEISTRTVSADVDDFMSDAIENIDTLTAAFRRFRENLDL